MLCAVYSRGGRCSASSSRTVLHSGSGSTECPRQAGCAQPAPAPPPSAQRSDTHTRSGDSTRRRISARVKPEMPSTGKQNSIIQHWIYNEFLVFRIQWPTAPQADGGRRGVGRRLSQAPNSDGLSCQASLSFVSPKTVVSRTRASHRATRSR